MRHLDVPIRDGEESGRGELLHDLANPAVRQGLHLAERNPTSGDSRPVARPGEAQEEQARGVLLGGREPGERLLGERGDRPAQPAEPHVGGICQGRAVTPFPELRHGGGQQGEQAGFVTGVTDDGVSEPVVEHEPSDRRRSLHRPAHLGRRQRADEHRAVVDEGAQRVMVGELTHEVGAHREHDGDRGPRVGRQLGEGVEELPALGVVGADRPDLLELVDRHDDAPLLIARCRHEVRQEVGHLVASGGVQGAPGELAHRVRAGPEGDDPPSAAAGEHVGGQRREQPGA